MITSIFALADAYKYNGKELQETGMYAYGWRRYMPDIARWNAIDQLSEKFHNASPYAYLANNPAMFFDPDGRDMAPWMSILWKASKPGEQTKFGDFSSDGTPSWMNSSSPSSQYSPFGDFSPDSTGIGYIQGANDGSSINDNLRTIDLPEVFLTGKSSDWRAIDTRPVQCNDEPV